MLFNAKIEDDNGNVSSYKIVSFSLSLVHKNDTDWLQLTLQYNYSGTAVPVGRGSTEDFEKDSAKGFKDFGENATVMQSVYNTLNAIGQETYCIHTDEREPSLTNIISFILGEINTAVIRGTPFKIKEFFDRSYIYIGPEDGIKQYSAHKA